MKTFGRPPSRPTRWLATALVWILALGQATLPAYAQSVPPLLADSPIAAKITAKPNIVYTLDDSGSMQLNYIPEYVNDAAATTNISAMTSSGTTATVTVPLTTALSVGDWVTIAGATPAGYNGYWQITSVTNGATTVFTFTIPAALAAATVKGNYTAASSYCRGGSNTAGCSVTVQGNNSFTSPPFFTADFNRMMYNPLVTYYPPKDDTGNPRTTANTNSKGDEGYTAAKWTTVQRDPYFAMFGSAVKDNLNTKVAVPLYCNTDWPITAGVNLALTPDVADANGQYLAGSGDFCRINGTKYDTGALSGGPPAGADYNYPWQPSTAGTTGSQYYFRQLANKLLWCDNTSPWWPRQTTTIQSCSGGTANYAPTQQKCNRNGFTCNPTAASRTFNPTTCKPPIAAGTSDYWCSPGVGGSDGFSPGTGGLPECRSCTCVADYQAPGGKCSVQTSVSCTGPYGVLGGDQAECPDIPSAVITSCTGGTTVYNYGKVPTLTCNSLLWDPSTNANLVPATTVLQDANGTGLVCRHNNQTYATGGAAGMFKYPSPAAGYAGDVTAAGAGQGQLGKFLTGTAAAGCPTIGTTVSIWRHYYTVSSVQFCDSKNLTPDDQWRGFGAGVCQAKNDLTTFKNVKYGTFTRHDLFATNPLPFPSGKAWLCTTPGCVIGPENSESVNYANWYAYYATRLNAAKTTSATAFSYLINKSPDPIGYRVGFHTLGDEPTPYGGGNPITWVDVDDWNPAQRTAWYTKLFGLTVSNYKTPTLSAMLRIGNLFERGGSAGVDAAKVNALPAGAKDPLNTSDHGLLSCAPNYHVLFTDGVTNQVAMPTSVGEKDKKVPIEIDAANATSTSTDQTIGTLVGNSDWPAPFAQGPVAIADTLADIAAWYWAHDLRDGTYGTPLKNDVPSSSGKITGPGTGALDPAKDIAWWQHVNFSAISFGTEGILDASNPRSSMGAVAKGLQSWTWPDLTQPNNPTHPFGPAAGSVAVDDLWHATVMARGWFVSAKSPIEVSYGLSSILSGIQNQRKSRAGAAFVGQVLNSTTNTIFQTTIEPGWAGDVLKVELNLDGTEKKTWWQAGPILATKMTPASAGDEPWNDETKRRIVTFNDSSGAKIPFRWANLSTAQKNSLHPDATMQKKMVAYLRGGSTYGVPPATVESIEGVGIGQFRQRSGILGDVSNAQAVVVGPPSRPYFNATDPGYESWKAGAIASRSWQVVAAANDGMVHVFDGGPMPSKDPVSGAVTPIAAGGGDELYAFIPKALFRGVAGGASEDPTGIQALTYQDGGIPIYRHHMYVDSSPRVADVDFANGGALWHTIVVGGLGKGGNSYYALDITDPSAPDEATAAAKILWEWSDPDIRYTYGRPVIVKVRETGYPTGRWVVLVTAGYNNVSGQGKIFVLDAKTGSLLRTINTGFGTGASPSGLAQIHAFVKDQSNQTAEQIYGGDLYGNLWRVDVSLPDSYKSAGAVLFAQLRDGAGVPQPVTTAPQIEIDVNNGIDRYVMIGTGRLLDPDDFTNPNPQQPQTMYAIRDGTLTNFLTAGLPIQPRVTMVPINPDGVSAIVGGAPNGWYHDLPVGERIVVDVAADVNIAAYIGTQAQDDPCVISLPATLYAHNYTDGKSLLGSDPAAPLASISIAQGAIGGTLIGRVDPTSGAVVSLGWLISREIPGSQPVDIINPVSGPGNRLSWRLLQGQ